MAALAPLELLAGGADRIVVIDTETTGLFRADRVVEIACVTVGLDRTIIDEWDTLINPCRDVGPTWLHGVTSSMLEDAPTFDEIASKLASIVDGAVLCAHNLPFDVRMLSQEFSRYDVGFWPGAGLDTLRVTRDRLGDACAAYGIELTGAHQALADARATAALMCLLADQFEVPTPAPARATGASQVECRRVCRDSSGSVTAETPYLARLGGSAHHGNESAGLVGYLELLDWALVDHHLSQAESFELAAYAGEYGLTEVDVAAAHRGYVDALIDIANGDGIVTADEYGQLVGVANALGVDSSHVDRRVLRDRIVKSNVVPSPGLSVCFTGQPVDGSGSPIPRDCMKRHAAALGLTCDGSVLKSTDLVVAADPASMSGKAKNAKRWMIPIVRADDFLAAQPGDSLPAVVFASAEAVIPRQTAPLGRLPAVSDVSPVAAAASTESLVCEQCGEHWSRVRMRGRKPRRCPVCR